MISAAFAEGFAADWIDAWNRHDLDAILAHYADDFEMRSPYIVQIAGEPSGVLRGKAAVGAYWAAALARMPDLRFTLIDTFGGVDSLIIHYQGARGPAAEVFEFGPDGRVIRAAAHYAP
jgi:ketosteroid isomerase-like protein